MFKILNLLEEKKKLKEVADFFHSWDLQSSQTVHLFQWINLFSLWLTWTKYWNQIEHSNTSKSYSVQNSGLKMYKWQSWESTLARNNDTASVNTSLCCKQTISINNSNIM